MVEDNLMKNLLLILFVIVSTLVGAQDVFNPIKNSIKSGDAAAIARQFNQQVDVTIDAKQGAYSKSQAETLLTNFFRENPPTEFVIMHTGSSKGGLQFAIGTYTSKKINYSVLIRTRDSGNARLIHEISFVKE